MQPHDQSIVAGAILGVGIVTCCVCLPLIYRRVPMNRFYGIRIPQSFVSAERWYDINAYGGRLLACWSCPITVAGIVGFLLPLTLFPSLCDYRCGCSSHQHTGSSYPDHPLGESYRSDPTR